MVKKPCLAPTVIGVPGLRQEWSRYDCSTCGMQAYESGEQIEKRGRHAQHMAKSQTGRPYVTVVHGSAHFMPNVLATTREEN